MFILAFVILLLYIIKLRKDINNLNYLFLLIVDKNLTEERIICLHEEERTLKENLKNIQSFIHNDMPKRAKKVILYDKLKGEEEAVFINYKKYIETKEEYNKLCDDLDNEIPKEILKEIEDYICPKYYLDNKKQKYSLMLTVISCLVAVLSIIPIFNMFSKYCILFGLYPLSGLFIVNTPKDSEKRKKYIRNAIFCIILFILIILELYLFLVNYCNWWVNYDAEIPFIFVSIILILMFIFKISLYIKNRRSV